MGCGKKIKFYICLYSAKLINVISKLFRFGSGFTWPGHFALKIFPDILNYKKFTFPEGVVLISGTNGKTTTSKLITHLLKEKGIDVVNNKTGANLLNGIVSEILLSMSLFGNHNSEVGVFEVDERNLPLVLKYINPKYLVLLNLSRDQLDRYGEIDLILDSWKKATLNLKKSTTLVIDSTQNYFSGLKENFPGDIIEFGLDKKYLIHTNLVGDFNAKNLNAAISVTRGFGLNEGDINRFSKSFECAYGRGELVSYKNNIYKILLAKNPASFNNNIKAIISENINGGIIWFILNDNIPDGRDVSWIYDIEPKYLKKVCKSKKVLVSGKRSLDMAVRLNYAEVDVNKDMVFENLVHSLDYIQKNFGKENIIVLPNYSAMLEVRKLLVGREIL